jgi:class 3 adenylate cyclase/tetratricopeptide (TPR) repeat protein
MAGCPSCGYETPADARFCSSCGTPLKAPAPASEQRKVVTILFCDLVGSTALGESTDPEALRARMRRYFEDLRAIVERHGGVVEKFVGDAVMAVFGIPVAHEDDALRAVRAAAEMRASVAEHGLEARIGVDTGEVVVGVEGETLVTGDAVNVAARLEQAAASGESLIGARTRALVRDAVKVEPVEPLALKGKSEPVEAFRLLEVIGDAAPLARHPETPLVGRERERNRLWRDFEDAVADRTCRLFTLLGPAGIGKSRLVADFVERVGDAADVLRGRCLHYGQGITYWPLVEMLVPLGVDPETVVASTPEETRVGFRRLLEARAAERPQVVVVDDLQWAEPVFVDLIEHIADLSRDAPILLLCIARNELLELRSGWGGGKLNATSLLLEPLGTEECAELMQRLDPEATLDADVQERITIASEGNPLFVEEMLAMVREGGGRTVAIPSTIQALLQARLDSLGDDERTVLGHAAVEGQVFHGGAVAELVPGELLPDLEAHLFSLIRKELIRPESSLLPSEDAFRFRHLLIREAAYGAMPKELRAQLHERYADWLERSIPDLTFERDEILGYHVEQAYRFRRELGHAGDEEQALAARAGARLLAAGTGALGRADLEAAASLLQRGTELFPRDDRRRLEALCDLAHALARRGELEPAEAILRSAIDDARKAGDEGVEARARLALNTLRVRVDPTFGVEAELGEALEIAETLERAGDDANLARAYQEIGMSRFMLGRAAEGEIDLGRAAGRARLVHDHATEREALASRLRPIAYGPTTAGKGIAFCTMLLESELANVADKAHALQVRALFHAMQADFDEARASSARAWALIEEFGLTLLKGIYSIDIGLAEALTGDLDRAERELRRGHDLLVAIGDRGMRSSVGAILADVLHRQGRDDEALELATATRAISGADDLDAQPRWRAATARVLARRGEHAEAEALAREAQALVAPTDFVDLKGDVHDVLGEVLAATGRVEEATAAIERAIALHEQKGNVVSAGRSRSVLNDLRATARLD